MVGYQQADPAAPPVLIREVSPLLLRFFASQCGNRAEAEDLLQDTWLQVHKARHTYRRGEPVLPWIYAIARHVRVNGYRRAQRIRYREQMTDTPPARPVPHAPESSGAPHFEELIAALPPSQREVISLLKVSGMSLEEVARATECSVGSVKLKAHRAYEKLRTVLSR